MSDIYDNWERLVAAVVKKQQLWELFHAQSRSPSEASEFSSSLNLISPVLNLMPSSSNSQKAPPKLVLFSDFSSAVNVENIHLSSAELLGRGTFGSTYAAAMDNGAKFVVKKLKSSVISDPDFTRQMEIVGNIRHENVVALRAYYTSEDERLMLYDCCSSGSVFALLHGETGHVDWDTRLRIAIGGARGIAEIHTHNGGKFVHGNVKSSNIFLNRQQYGYVSDIGVARMIATKSMPISWYYAPEVKNTQNVSQASDVYSFGILLFELLTRKSPVRIPGGPDAVDLVKLVSSVKSKIRASKVFDADLLEHRAITEQIVKVLRIGISCIKRSPEKRPKMSDIVKMLEHLRMMKKLGSNIWFEKLEGKLVFVEDGPPSFAIQDMLEAFADFLGFGTFGTSYMAILRNGNNIVIKRLRDMKITFKELHQHMEIIGRMNHENVANLRAFHFRENDVLFMYDYINGASVSALLHGEKSTGQIRLDWATRLKTAVGAARGIAHIHKQDNCKLVHGNVKSSNIFIDGEKYGVVSDVGLAKVMKKRSNIQVDYYAPEIKGLTRGSQSQDCDVYNFGIVLLELVSGRPSKWTNKDGRVVSLVNWIQRVCQNEGFARVFDAKLSWHSIDEEEAALQMLLIAMDCVDYERRPKMSRVLRKLEAINGIQTESQQSLGSRLEHLLEELLPML